MNFLRSLFRHLCHNRELYVFPPVVCLLIVGAICGAPLLTGRAVLDDPGVIVGYLYAFVPLALASLWAGLVQSHLFGYRSTGGAPSFRDDLYDACVTIFLLCFAAHVLLR